MAHIHTGNIAHLLDDPFKNPDALEIIENGALLIDDQGVIRARGARSDVIRNHPEASVTDHGSEAWLIPGFVDGHIHFPQFLRTASHGTELLDWLNRGIFPGEAKLADPALAKTTAEAFVAHLLANGTTTALVFGSQFQHANQALFDTAAQQGMRIIAGPTLMDRNAPENILMTPRDAHNQCTALIQHIKDQPLAAFAITPRFSISCTPEMMDVCSDLLKNTPDAYVQTHINENREEIAAVAGMFPEAANYLDVYDRHNLLSPKTVLAHNIHATPAEMSRISDSGCAVCHCPDSNMYLGSGLFPLKAHLAHNIPVLVGTDVGAGTHFSILEELGAVYKVQQLNRFMLGPAEMLYLGTLAGAKALKMDRIGNFEVGREADLLVLSTSNDSYLARRLQDCDSTFDMLYSWLILGRDRHIQTTMVRGRVVYSDR